MRLSKGQAEKNRDAIIDAAAELFRERGYDGVGLNELMKKAGFTHGGFYNHFDSKETLAAEAYRSSFAHYVSRLTSELEKNIENAKSGKQALHSCMDVYLSTAHRDDPAHGCPASALAIDAMRRDPSTQSCYADGIESYIAIFTKHLSLADSSETDLKKTSSRELAFFLLTQIVGAMVLSRAVSKCKPSLSDELLKAARQTISASLDDHDKPTSLAQKKIAIS